MADFTEYITKEGERWDNIAYAAYGDVAKLSDIIAANPGIPITGVLPAGTRINLPIVDTVAPEIDETQLPPWKR